MRWYFVAAFILSNILIFSFLYLKLNIVKTNGSFLCLQSGCVQSVSLPSAHIQTDAPRAAVTFSELCRTERDLWHVLRQQDPGAQILLSDINDTSTIEFYILCVFAFWIFYKNFDEYRVSICDVIHICFFVTGSPLENTFLSDVK